MARNLDAEKLLEKYRNGTISETELQVLEGWYNDRAGKGIADVSEQEIHKNLDKIWLKLNPTQKPVKIHLWKRLTVAASILLVIGAGALFYNSSIDTYTGQLVVKNDIAPGKNQAYLILANGKKVLLKDAENGTVAQESGVTITKSADGSLIYTLTDDNSNKDSDGSQYNSIQTPRGGQYQVILPDGTRVWLNAASTLKYPTRFSKDERLVELTGEAYFEVMRDPAKPFIMRTQSQKVTVVGTRFNVNSYPEENTQKTTLVEGSVRIAMTGGGNAATLKPGQEYESKNGKVNIKEVNALESIAWKEGEFVFSDEPLESIMNKIARWYDVEIIYDSIDPTTRFGGAVSRFSTVSKVLEKLQLTGDVGFRIEGRTITVTK